MGNYLINLLKNIYFHIDGETNMCSRDPGVRGKWVRMAAELGVYFKKYKLGLPQLP